jgi:hypothetical protein
MTLTCGRCAVAARHTLLIRLVKPCVCTADAIPNIGGPYTRLRSGTDVMTQATQATRKTWVSAYLRLSWR